jgi:outer membrane protein assembly factor BamD (BamD/ComL family)
VEVAPAPPPLANAGQKRGAAAGSAKDASSLPEELSALESARRALVAGDPKRALQLLEDYARRFSKPRLGTEAAVLRIEALMANGDRARANQLGTEFLAKHTNGPYERRVRSLIVGAKERRDRGP